MSGLQILVLVFNIIKESCLLIGFTNKLTCLDCAITEICPASLPHTHQSSHSSTCEFETSVHTGAHLGPYTHRFMSLRLHGCRGGLTVHFSVCVLGSSTLVNTSHTGLPSLPSSHCSILSLSHV